MPAMVAELLDVPSATALNSVEIGDGDGVGGAGVGRRDDAGVGARCPR